MAATLLLCAQERPATQRECKRRINRVLGAVADQLGHTTAVCRASYVHPRVVEDFATDRLALLAPQIRGRVGKPPSRGGRGRGSRWTPCARSSRSWRATSMAAAVAVALEHGDSVPCRRGDT